jgi:hypothetical protein
VKIVDVGELFCDVLPECVARSSWRDPPATPYWKIEYNIEQAMRKME